MLLRLRRAVVAALCLGAAGGCSAAIHPIHRQDAQTAVRVKTALINDRDLGVLPIEVQVSDGVVTLSGRVRTQAEAERAAALARGVPGVTAVTSDLHVGDVGTAPPSEPGGRGSPLPGGEPDLDLRPSSQRRFLAVGLSLGWSRPRDDRLADRITLGPLVRIGSGDGLGPTVGFGWYRTDVHSAVDPSRRLAQVRVRPVMGGLALRRAGDRISTSLELVTGVAFNGIQPRAPIQAGEVPVDVSASFAWRPSGSVWIDLNARIAVNLSAGYVMTRPRLTMIEDGRVTTRRMRADALLVKTGLVYKLF